MGGRGTTSRITGPGRKEGRGAPPKEISHFSPEEAIGGRLRAFYDKRGDGGLCQP